MASAVQSVNFDEQPVRKPLISRHTINEKVRDALHLYAGRGCRYSVAALAEATGVPERCIEAAKCEPDDPNHRPLALEYLASIAKFLRDPFASAFLEPCDLGAFELNDQPPLPKVFEKADEIVAHQTTAEKRRHLLRQLQALEDE